MASLQRVAKPKTKRGHRILLAREPKTIEDAKNTLLLRGRNTSQTLMDILRDMHNLKKPDTIKLQQKNDITIFEDAVPVENLCKKFECSLFLIASHSKKRPNNLVVGRTFDHSLLDMVELGTESYKSLREFPASKIIVGTKPCLFFSGPAWEQTEEMQTLRSIFVDMFHREKADAVRLQGLEHAIHFIATPEGKILFRSYKVFLKKSGSRVPRIELEEIGPRLDMFIRRSKLPSPDLMKQACRKPKVLRIHKKKNISRDNLGTTHGRIHVGKQDINKIQTRKMKALKKLPTKRKATSENGPAAESKVPKVQTD